LADSYLYRQVFIVFFCIYFGFSIPKSTGTTVTAVIQCGVIVECL